MAQISKKSLLDPESNSFLESLGFINITNSFEGSSWRSPELNMIFNIDEDYIIRNTFDLCMFFYHLGHERGVADLTQRSFLKDII